MKKFYGIMVITLTVATNAFSAEAIDLARTEPALLSQTLFNTSSKGYSGYQQKSTHTDQNGMAHIRIRQTWAGYPVWGADAILHVPPSSASLQHLWLSHPVFGTRVNGTAYIKLNNDLIVSPKRVFTQAASEAALQKAFSLYRQKTGTRTIINRQRIHAIVYVDKQQKAHWAWQIDFKTSAPHHRPAIPTFIIDAQNHTVYKEWDNLQTVVVQGGGYGGNPRMGKKIYDGLKNSLPSLTIERDENSKICMLSNDEVIVKDRHASIDDTINDDTLSTFPCEKQDSKHNKIFWDDSLNATNGAYSPDNDALFIGHIVQQMYRDWYGIPALIENNAPMKLIMRVHDFEFPDNAFWDGEQMTFGDGGDEYYPFTALNIGAHEISHGFTEQHSNLIYEGQSGGLNESFSDIAGAAADYYAYGKNSWQLGAEISKVDGNIFRYMDTPSKDCEGRMPGYHCSIDKASQFKEHLNVHFSSGVFNRAFYLLSTAPGWNTHKAFDVMVKANQDYWVPTSTFQQAACGVMDAATDLGYETDRIKTAFLEVELDTSSCRTATNISQPS